MKLYYIPGYCSLSPHIVLHEAGLNFEIERVDTASCKTESGADFAKINPKRYVPALLLDDGQVLTEGAAIVQYLADLRPETGLAPKAGSMQRVRLQEYLNYIAAEYHKSFSPLFAQGTSEQAKVAAIANVGRRLDYFENIFADGRPYLMGDTFTVADAYLFVVTNWTKLTNISLDKWPHVIAYVSRVAGREKVGKAMRAEGLL